MQPVTWVLREPPNAAVLRMLTLIEEEVQPEPHEVMWLCPAEG